MSSNPTGARQETRNEYSVSACDTVVVAGTHVELKRGYFGQRGTYQSSVAYDPRTARSSTFSREARNLDILHNVMFYFFSLKTWSAPNKRCLQVSTQ